jgi:hypothetical protein
MRVLREKDALFASLGSSPRARATFNARFRLRASYPRHEPGISAGYLPHVHMERIWSGYGAGMERVYSGCRKGNSS